MSSRWLGGCVAVSGSSSDGSSSHDDASSGSASSVGSSGEEGEEAVGNMVVGRGRAGRGAGCGGERGWEADDLELWLVRAPRGFDMRALNKRKIELDAEGRVQSADLSLPSGDRVILRENFSGAHLQTVAFIPSGKSDGDMVVAKPFARQLDIVKGLPQAPKLAAFAGVTHPAYSRVPQIDSMEYRLIEALRLGLGSERDDERQSRRALLQQRT